MVEYVLDRSYLEKEVGGIHHPERPRPWSIEMGNE